MRHLAFLTITLFLTFSVQSEVLLECKPLDKKKKRLFDQHLLLVMVTDGYSSILESDTEEGVYIYTEADAKMKKISAFIALEYINYYGNFYIDRKNLELRQSENNFWTGKRKEKLIGNCELLDESEFLEIISKKVSDKKADNLF